MNSIRIFIASSAELLQDRKQFREFLSIENDRLHKRGVYLELVQWENFIDTVSQTRLQDEYNLELKKSSIVICLFFSKAGKYTQEEFDTALQHFKDFNSPLIYTYFKTGAPVPDPTDEQGQDLIKFKKRLGEIGHFYTSYNNIDDLKYQFRRQLDRLEDKGLIVMQEEVKNETRDAVTNYFNIKNAVIGSTISAGGNVHIGDTVANTVSAQGNNNIIIQGVSDSSITVNVNGQSQEISNKLDSLQSLLEKLSVQTFQTDNKVYNIESINNVNFGFLMAQAGHDKSLPAELAQNLVGPGNGWIQSLRQELQDKQKVSVGSQSWNIFQNYGWLVETFLQKMSTATGQEKNLRRLSFMAEAYQGSLRYLCYIQMARILQLEKKPRLGIISDFIQMEGNKFQDFDYTSFLLTTTDALAEEWFMKEINKFVEELTDTESALYGTALYLEDQRRKLIANSIAEDDKLPGLLDEYLTALVYWLRKISFLAKYRLVSIKEINLNYRIGTAKNFVHLYGELHGLYSEGSSDEDYNTKSVEGIFTYNKSILLFRGNDVASCMDKIDDQSSYLSLSPLVIDQSVYAGKPTQTPEIFYYTGYNKSKRQYNYSQYKNELAFGGKDDIVSNKSLKVLAQNNNQPHLDELFEQLEEVFKPLKNKQS